MYKKQKRILAYTLILFIALQSWASAYENYQNIKTALIVPAVKEVPFRSQLDLYLDKLVKYECHGPCLKNPRFRIIDSNGKYSYSCLQFQEATFFSMTKKYNIEIKAWDDIYNCDIQKKVAKAMWMDTKAATKVHWYHSIVIRGLGLPSKYQ